MKKEILFVDMDGVVADFDKGIRKYGFVYEDHKDEDERHAVVDKLCEEHDRIFLELEVIKGSQEAVAKLEKNYEIYFLSTPMHNVPPSYMDKRLWLGKHFPGVSHKKLILTHNKGLAKGAYLIDDRIKNGVEDFEGKHIHFGTEEFPNWDAVLKYLL